MIDLSIIEEEKATTGGAQLKVIGIGGAGGNAVNSMINSEELKGVEFIIANTDAQSLATSPAHKKIQLGTKITKGLGAGSNPEIGRRAAEEDLNEVVEHILDADILFLTAGLGGGTGSGALPVIAAAAKELGILTVTVVTKPFSFEGKRRLKHAEDAIKNLHKAVDTLLVVPNQKLLEIVDPKISMLNAFAISNEILKQAIKGISDIITKAGHINVDFADVKAIMKDMGMAIMGTGKASGQDRARKAAQLAINSPLLENVSIQGAKGVLINIMGNSELGLQEINEAASLVYDLVSQEANIILGSVIDDAMGDEIMVTVIATGFDASLQSNIAAPVLVSEPVQSVRAVQDVWQQPTKDLVTAQELQFSPEREHVAERASEQVTAAHALDAQSLENIIESIKVQEQENLMSPSVMACDAQIDLNDLDTPTFLRRKADTQMKESE